MKYLIFSIFGLFALTTTLNANASAADRTIYSCEGYTREELEEADIAVSITEHNGKFSAKIKIGDSDQTVIPVEQKGLGADEISFYDTFFNKDQGVRVEVFLDDMGFMSSLQFKNQKYDLTCG